MKELTLEELQKDLEQSTEEYYQKREECSKYWGRYLESFEKADRKLEWCYDMNLIENCTELREHFKNREKLKESRQQKDNLSNRIGDLKKLVDNFNESQEKK